MLAATVRVTRDIDLAQECVQEAYAAALRSWPQAGVPGNPAAWLTTAARRRAIDALRREHALRTRLPLLVVEAETQAARGPGDGDGHGRPWTDQEGAMGPSGAAVPDDRLRLIFTCCHPALATEAQVALTLRLMCGVTTADIARSFLVPEATMAARITRAKKKIAVARIPYRVPRQAELPERLRAVLNVVHLLFTAGHTAPSGPSLVRADLVEHALLLASLLQALMPDETEVRGLHALLLVTDARRATRADERGRLIRLEDQDRTRWDRAAIAQADALITGCLRAAVPGRYVLHRRRRSRPCTRRRRATRRPTGRNLSPCTTRCCGYGRPRWWRSTARFRSPWRPDLGRPWRRSRTWSGTSRAGPEYLYLLERSRRTCCRKLGRTGEGGGSRLPARPLPWQGTRRSGPSWPNGSPSSKAPPLGSGTRVAEAGTTNPFWTNLFIVTVLCTLA